MNADDTTSRRSGRASGRWPRTRAWLSRVISSSGAERENMVIVLKSALAAWLSWFVAYELISAKNPAFAPFSAVWMMQVTVYQSVVQSLRYLGAASAGVAIQALVGFVIGSDLLAFAVVALAALAIARWPTLGTQGTLVSTAAFFAFSTYLAATTVSDRITQLGQLLLLVLVGSAIGVAVNILVLPPLRYRSAEYGLRRVAEGLTAVLEDIGPALRDDALDSERTGRWRGHMERVGQALAQARAAVGTSRESRRYNPRQLLPGNRQYHGFRGYEAVLDALDRASHQLASLVRALDRSSDGRASLECGFARRYADCTDSLAAFTRQLSEVEESRLRTQTDQLGGVLEEAEDCAARLDRSAERLEASLLLAEAPPYGVLLVEAHRLVEEFRHTFEVLTHSIPEAARSPRGKQHRRSAA